jgi:hypothetical protein
MLHNKVFLVAMVSENIIAVGNCERLQTGHATNGAGRAADGWAPTRVHGGISVAIFGNTLNPRP